MAAPGFEYFDHTTVGAPGIWPAAGRMTAFLDWVLTGKGGWATEFTGTNLRVYRSLTGNRFRLRLDDTQAIYSRLRAYRAMTAISTGTNQFPTNAQAAANINTWGMIKGYAAGTVPRRYWGIRTNRYMVLIVEGVVLSEIGTNYRTLFIFGDFPSLCEADTHNTLIAGVPRASTDWFQDMVGYQTIGAIGPDQIGNAGNAFAAVSGTPSGAVLSPVAALHRPFTTSATGYMPAIVESQRLSFGPLLVGNSNHATSPNGQMVRGMLPNVSQLYGGSFDGDGLASDPGYPCADLIPFSMGARTFLPVLGVANAAGSYTGQNTFLLETTDTDGAL